MKPDPLKKKVVCECGRSFLSSAYNARYCSDRCRVIGHRLRYKELYLRRKSGKLVKSKIIKCRVCSGNFDNNGTGKIYCSAECKKVFSRKRERKRQRAYYLMAKKMLAEKYGDEVIVDSSGAGNPPNITF